MKNRLAWLFVFVPGLGIAQTPRPVTAPEMLSKAVRMGDFKNVDSLINAGANPNAANQYGRTPLYYAALFNRDRVTALLLANQADPNIRANSGAEHGVEFAQTPLQVAASMGNLQIASMLIGAGANVRATTEAGRTALHFAVVGSHLDVIRFLIEKGADVDARDSQGTSALDESVWRGSLESTAILLANGAPLNEPETKSGATPINEAAYRNQPRLVIYLLKFHPDLRIPDRHGYTPLENAVRMGNQDIAIALLKAEPIEQKTPDFLNQTLVDSAKKNAARLAEALLEERVAAQAAVNVTSALDVAVSAGSADVARLLLAHGADPNGDGRNGTTPLESAALKGRSETAVLLLDGGADVNHINAASGTTALYAAAAFGRGELVKLLLQHGAIPNLCGKSKITPYKAAIQNGFGDIATEIRGRGGSNICLDSGQR